MAHTRVISVPWLIEQAKRVRRGEVQKLPACQKLPPEAQLSFDQLLNWQCDFNSLPILVLSYCWLDPDPPDGYGKQLCRLLPIFEAFNQQGLCGCVWDWCSLPQ